MAASGATVRSFQSAANAPPVPADGFVDNKYASASAQLDADLGFALLTVIPAYRWQHSEFFTSPAGTLNFAEQDHVHQESVEARLARNTDALKLVARSVLLQRKHEFRSGGLSGRAPRRDHGSVEHLHALSRAHRCHSPLLPTQTCRSPRVCVCSVAFAIRRRSAVSTARARRSPPSLPCRSVRQAWPFRTQPSAICLVTDPDNSLSNNATTWRGGVEFDVAQDSMAYLTVNRGFKSGGVYSGPAPDNTYRARIPDRPSMQAFATGSSTTRLQLNLEAFYWKYSDYQFTFVNFATNGTQALVTTNAGKARLYGANADIILTPTKADTLSLTAEYLSSGSRISPIRRRLP